MVVRFASATLVLIATCCVVATTPLSAQRQESDLLRSFIPQLEQDALQLRGMTDDQRKALATLLAGYYFAGVSNAVLEGTLNDSFEGWDGDTLVELTDGSVFKQSEYHYEYMYSYRPDVTIFVKPFSYEILVEGSDEPVETELIRGPRIGGGLIGQHEGFKRLLVQLPEEAALRALSLRGGPQSLDR